jgi:hypothetical protein
VAPRWRAVLILGLTLLATGCRGSEPEVRFVNTSELESPAPVPKPSRSLRPGDSDVVADGELSLETTANFHCFKSIDDFFVDGKLGYIDGQPVFLRINVEFYKEPGVYEKRAQILVRLVEQSGTQIDYYASWYFAEGTITVRDDGRAADLDRVVLPPEPGTDSKQPITIQGHFACPR